MAGKLEQYNKKRDFNKTLEPEGKLIPPGKELLYSVQKHDASRLHYDLRLEWEGVLLSWAVPKGPSLNPKDKRLAVRVEDHPVDYRTFEGTIPQGEYGGGTVQLFDQGTWEPLRPVDEGLEKGELKFNLHGKRFKGRFVLVQMKNSENDKNWLLIKEKDEFVDPKFNIDNYTTSVESGETMEEIAENQAIEQQHGKESDLPRDTETTELGGRLPFNKAEVMLARLQSKAPAGEEWANEIKYDGYRMLAFREKETVRLISRNQLDWTAKFPAIAESLATWHNKANFVLDGEIVALDEQGRTDFQSLQGALKNNKNTPLTYMVFDLLALGKTDLRDLPLSNRRALLEKLMVDLPAGISLSPIITGGGTALFEKACFKGLEGIVSKRMDSIYSAGRNGNWVKVKCENRQELVIVGYTKTKKVQGGLSALLLGFFEKGHLIYAGRAGTGFTEDEKADLLRQFKPLIRSEETVDLHGDKRTGEQVIWLKPEMVAEIRFAEKTDDGLLRQASFKGLRADKAADEVKIETEDPMKEPVKKSPSKSRSKSKKGIELSSPDKVLISPGITKAQIADYYSLVMPKMLPMVQSRPVSLFRCPDGTGAECFYMKHYADQIHGINPLPLVENDGDKVTYMSIEDEAGIVGAVQMSTIEFHVWGSRRQTLEKPDWVVFDLDPDEGMDLDPVRGGVKDLVELIDALGLKTRIKTSGGKGYHIVLPIKPAAEWDTVRTFAKRIADLMEAKWPKKYTSNMRKENRKSRIYVDWVRNGRGATSVAPYSLRARENAPVSCPIDFKDLDKIGPRDVTIANINEYLTSDPWRGIEKTTQELGDDS